MPNEPTTAAPALGTSDKRELVPLNRFDATFVIHRALGRKRFGHVKSEVERTVSSLVAEIVMEALAEDGIVLAHPRYPDNNVPLGRPRNPHLTE